jgi:hypothetical protein
MPTVASTLCPPPCAKWEIRYSHLHMVGHCLSPLTNNSDRDLTRRVELGSLFFTQGNYADAASCFRDARDAR